MSKIKLIWEYQIVEFGSTPQEIIENRLRILNEQGAEGWELASVGASGYVAYFKRTRYVEA